MVLAPFIELFPIWKNSKLLDNLWRAPKSWGETHLGVSQSQVAESWDLEARSQLPTLERVEGWVGSPGIRLGRRFSRSSLNLHQNKPPTWLVHISGHPWVLGQATGTLDHKTHHSLDSGEATTFPHILFSTPLRRAYIQMALFPGTPKLESRNCPGWSPGNLGAHNSRLQSRIAMRFEPKL
jgi:hypothetical protein